MRKIQLEIDDLQVESFSTDGVVAEGGTVEGADGDFSWGGLRSGCASCEGSCSGPIPCERSACTDRYVACPCQDTGTL